LKNLKLFAKNVRTSASEETPLCASVRTEQIYSLLTANDFYGQLLIKIVDYFIL